MQPMSCDWMKGLAWPYVTQWDSSWQTDGVNDGFSWGGMAVLQTTSCFQTLLWPFCTGLPVSVYAGRGCVFKYLLTKAYTSFFEVAYCMKGADSLKPKWKLFSILLQIIHGPILFIHWYLFYFILFWGSCWLLYVFSEILWVMKSCVLQRNAI